MRFSQRLGLTPVRVAIQGRTLDQATRARLWNAFAASVPIYGHDVRYPFSRTWMYELFRRVWSDFFKEPIDEMPSEDGVRDRLKTLFIEGEWFEAFDLIEFLLTSGGSTNLEGFRGEIQRILTEEMAGFRWVKDQFIEITDESEILAIEEALEASRADRFSPARRHLESALQFLSDRRAPDYRNSIKESISAVEAIVRILTGDPRAELGKGLKLLEERAPLHGAFRSALASLYGYTSDAEGIRHALTEAETLDAADAKFMLVACAAFVVYLIQKLDT